MSFGSGQGTYSELPHIGGFGVGPGASSNSGANSSDGPIDGSAWVLVAVTLEGCGHCKVIHENWMSTILPRLNSKFPRIEAHDIHLYSNRDPIDSAMWPADLDRFVKEFPTIMLIPKWEWVQAKSVSVYRFTQLRTYLGNFGSGSSASIIDGIIGWMRMNMQSQQQMNVSPQLPVVASQYQQQALPPIAPPVTMQQYSYKFEPQQTTPAPVHLPYINPSYGGPSSTFPVLPRT